MSKSCPTLLLLFTLTIVLFQACKKEAPEISGTTPDQASEEELLASAILLDQAYDRFIYEGSVAGGNVYQALEATRDWLLANEQVADAFLSDSGYLRIHYASGLENLIWIDFKSEDGTSVRRGGGSGEGVWLQNFAQSTGSGCSDPMANNKVLFYTPAYDEFGLSGQQAECLQLLADSEYNFEVTTLKNEECTPDAFLTFPQYGLVLIDTHGLEDATMCGIELDIPLDSTWNLFEFRQFIVSEFGMVNFQRFVNKELLLTKGAPIPINDLNWFSDPFVFNHETTSTYMSTTFISQLGSLQNTIVYNSSCYSGLTLATEYFPTPIASTYLSKNPLAYYGWKKANGGSSTVGDSECQIAETKYVQNISEADSSGIAHLNDDGTEFLAFNNWNQPAPKTKLVLFNQPTWCFTDCGLGTLTDTRDGKVYATTCIDGKTWMAENLNYAGAGMCFNSTANCNTFGRLYDWNTVSGGSSSNANPSNVQGVCPQGWHLPSIAEWNELIDFAGGATIAGRKLKAISPLWEDSNTNTDAYGFSALPGGECSEDGSGGIDCFNQGDDANFWSSSEPAGQYVFITGGDFIISNFAPLGSNFSCRCVKD